MNTVYSNKDYMNYALSVVGKKDIPTDTYHWSSSEGSYDSAWYLTFSNGRVGSYDRYSGDFYVRPVLAF